MFKKIDIFGSQILLRFQGEPAYSTRTGSVVTLLIIGFICFRLIAIIQDVFLRTSPQVIYSERQVDNPAPFEISSQSFPLAFGMEDPNFRYYIDEGIYTIQATYYTKTLVLNQTTQQNDAVWNITHIKVQPCTLENFKNPDNLDYYTSLQYQNMYCLPPDIKFTLQGDFVSPIYSYLEILVVKCKENCKSKEELDHYLLNSNFAMQLSDSFVNPSIKSNPFKIYSRDIYWATSTQMPKAATVYLRNNYVQSDFGWFLPDLTTQRYPAYSYNDVSVFPDNFQTYFLSVTFRFEKQKEGFYSRTYKNFNNIMSEIGGFTQSLLAIGYLICTRVSQLQLNQTLINQAFSYEDSKDESEENKDTKKQQILQKLQLLNYSQQSPCMQNQLQKSTQQQNQRFNLNQIMKKSSDNQNQNLKANLDYLNNPATNSQLNVANQINIQQNQSLQIQSFEQAKQYKDNENFDSNQHVFNNRNNLKLSSPDNKQTSKQLDQKKILNFLIQDVQMSDELTQGGKDQEVLDQSNHVKIQKQKMKIKQFEQKLKENRFNELMQKETKCMKMSIWEYFKSNIYPFGELKKKKQIIQYSIDKLYYNLDIFNILKKLVEVEKLKRLLLDPEQLKLFDYLPKPTIHSDLVLNQDQNQDTIKKSYEVDVLYQDHRTEMQKVRDAFQAYKKIVSKQNHTMLDQKIIDLLDPNLVSIFQAEGIQGQNNFIEKSNIETMIQQSKNNTFSQQTPKIQKEQIQGEALQEISLSKQDEIIDKQDFISPRLIIDSQPFLLNTNQQQGLQQEEPKFEVNNIFEQMSKSNQQNVVVDQIKDLSQSVYSEIAAEESQQMPNYFQSNQNVQKDESQ
ncbi:small GTP-binding domain protein (macronuclear) [Tetrahymena thermophila SB210]|uniref:Small GTP-binding domain protein n=1 Tax=Tetrahymena thermophila (strain SB210) TaxID=312017 RepID=I7LWN0_TETTS|nr:small GTP-binding domain protein [Tetrahymena thermophila SB210]EAS02393.2 small GTP-binding domain protein [Tetrahymena thermophila SB210]|eukprot:XP_001022638.2 small GTP-binding domain protein [Tetrahymena thermophila SB210]